MSDGDIWAGILGFVLLIFVGGLIMWRSTRTVSEVFVFRSIENLPPEVAGGCNAWQGVLEIDRVITPTEGEILRAAVERYRARVPWPPKDGDRFHLVDGELVGVPW